MILPPVRQRRTIDKYLSSFFHGYRTLEFRRALSLLCEFYRLKHPRIEWYEYLDWGKTAGKTYENGTIHLVHPENWKRGRKYNSERQWVNMVYHEMGHYIYWVDAERKADTFACRMVRGLNQRRQSSFGESSRNYGERREKTSSLRAPLVGRSGQKPRAGQTRTTPGPGRGGVLSQRGRLRSGAGV